MSLSVDDVLARVAAALKVPGPDALEPWWLDVCLAALESAAADVRGALLARNFTLEQIDAWAGLDAYVSDQALYWSLVNGAGTEAFDDRFVKQMDRREAIKTAQVTEVNDKGLTVLSHSDSVGHGRLKGRCEAFQDERGRWKPW